MPCTGISALSPLAKPIGFHRARHCDVHHLRLPARHGLGTWRSAVVPLLKHHGFRINNSLSAAGNSRPSRPCFVRPAQAESSDQELSELHEELLKQVVFNLVTPVKASAIDLYRLDTLVSVHVVTMEASVQISERKKLHQHLMNRLQSQGKGALTAVSFPTLYLSLVKPLTLVQHTVHQNCVHPDVCMSRHYILCHTRQ